MDDTISRASAIDALERIFDRCEEIEAHLPEGDPDRVGYKMYPDWLKVWNYLRQLPSTQPKRGKWIDAVIPNDNGDLLVQVCDQCNTFFPLAYTGGGHHFCPNCGADMRGDTE